LLLLSRACQQQSQQGQQLQLVDLWVDVSLTADVQRSLSSPAEAPHGESISNAACCCLLQVGGATLDAVLAAARPHARIVACGAISQYDLPEEQRYGVKNLLNVSTIFTILWFCLRQWAFQKHIAA
jgi:hypothetical protein